MGTNATPVHVNTEAHVSIESTDTPVYATLDTLVMIVDTSVSTQQCILRPNGQQCTYAN